MAYRKLVDCDLVRIVDVTNTFHGRDAVVIDAQENYARVQLNVDRTGHRESFCVDIPNKNLLVRDSPYFFIKDGRHDENAMNDYEQAQRKGLLNDRNYVDIDEDDQSEYDFWGIDDFISRIKELESVIAEYEQRF